MADEPAEQVFDAIHSLMHLYRAQRHNDLRDGPRDLSHMEHKVLGFFARHPGSTQSDLAVHSGRDKGQLARLVASLKARGLLEARVDELDRRNVRLHLTTEAQAVHQALQRHERRMVNAAVAGLSEEERGQLLELLGRIRLNLESQP
ncbi:MarR family winged helix-turn-helix transcriptional regulator [Rivibacter subsaxonicus]|nr:MarR family transcriptional regulator [Rivibacter subsaxonicus]